MLNEAVIDGITIAGQPTDEELARLAARGYHTVVNNRPQSEQAEPEAPKIPDGVRYCEVAFTAPTLNAQHVAAVAEAIESSEGPVLVHCAGGTRAAVVVAAAQAERRGLAADAALEMVRSAGFDPAGPYEAFLRRYLG